MTNGLTEIREILGKMEKLMSEADEDLKAQVEELKRQIKERDDKIYDLEGLIRLRKWEITETGKHNKMIEDKIGKIETIEGEIEQISEMSKKDWVRINELMGHLDGVVNTVKPIKKALKQLQLDLQAKQKAESASGGSS